MLKKLKYLLNSYKDEELEEMELWVDCKDPIKMIAVEKESITLITEDGVDNLEIDGKCW